MKQHDTVTVEDIEEELCQSATAVQMLLVERNTISTELVFEGLIKEKKEDKIHFTFQYDCDRNAVRSAGA